MRIPDGKKRDILLAAAEIAVLILYALYSFLNYEKVQLVYMQEEMALQTQGGGNVPGSYLDRSYAEAEGVVTPQFDLPEGIYYVDAEYEARGPLRGGLIYEIAREGNDLVNDNEFAVKSEAGKVSYRVKIQDGEGIRFRLRLTGDAADGDYLNLRQVSITGTPLSCVYRIFWLVAGIVCIDVLLLLAKKYRRSRTEDRVVMIVLLLAGFGLGLPLYQEGIKAGIDLPFHLSRIEGIYEGLKEGQFPVRIQPGWVEEHGYAASIFYGDVLLYYPALLRMVGCTLQEAYKWFLVMVHLATLLSAYYCFKTCFQDKAVSLTGALLFAGSSERLFRVYDAAQVGAFSAMIFYPVVFAGLFLLLAEAEGERSRKAWVYLTVGFAGLLWTHMISGLIVGSFSLLACIVRFKVFLRKSAWIQAGKALGAWLLLNLWFLVPFLQYMGGKYQITSMLSQDMADINYHAQLANYSKSSGTAAGIFLGTKESLGHTLVLVLILFLVTLPLRRKGKETRQSYMILGLAAVGGILCMNLLPSVRLAQFSDIFLKLFKTVQYGIRFLSVATFLVCCLACYFLMTLQVSRKWLYAAAAGLCIFACVQDLDTLGAVVPDSMFLEPVDLGGNILGNGEYVPSGTNMEQLSREIGYDTSALTVEDVKRRYLSFELRVENRSDTAQMLSFPVLYYEGYGTKDMVSGERLETIAGENNRVSVWIPEGYSGTLRMEFCGFWYWRAAELISALSLAVGICAAVWYNRRGMLLKEKRAGMDGGLERG